MDYLKHYAIDTAYIAPQKGSDERPKYKRRIYETTVLLLRDETNPPPIRAMRLWPGTDWNMVWKNLHETPATEDVNMDWYKVIHDLIPT
jgi:hypothetical protein